MIELKQTKTYEKWEARLRDKRAKTIIASTQARDIAAAKKLAKEWSE
ncbi:MAG TPA: hypothetical protein VNS29_01915 [Burkholderiaceae bacterium]|nr:hypothetical protein [Burkholderiaceae bacterium]